MRKRAAAALILLGACGGPADDAYATALAALRDGDPSRAESAAQGLGGHPGLRDFLLGNAAFVRCTTAEKQAASQAAEPFAWDVAIQYGVSARDLWQRAAMTRPDWPAARRNVERALLRIEELRRRKAEAEDKRRRKTDPQPKPKPKPKPAPRPDPKPEPDRGQQPQLKELAPEEVMALIGRLAEKEREKRALRRSQREKRMAGTERDW